MHFLPEDCVAMLFVGVSRNIHMLSTDVFFSFGDVDVMLFFVRVLHPSNMHKFRRDAFVLWMFWFF